MKTKIWVAVHTPFNRDGSIDFEGVKSNVEQYVARGIDGIFCNGLFGENWSVSADERVEIARAVMEAAKGRLKICSVDHRNRGGDYRAGTEVQRNGR